MEEVPGLSRLQAATLHTTPECGRQEIPTPPVSAQPLLPLNLRLGFVLYLLCDPEEVSLSQRVLLCQLPSFHFSSFTKWPKDKKLLALLLPLPPQSGNYRHEPSYLALCVCFPIPESPTPAHSKHSVIFHCRNQQLRVNMVTGLPD